MRFAGFLCCDFTFDILWVIVIIVQREPTISKNEPASVSPEPSQFTPGAPMDFVDRAKALAAMLTEQNIATVPGGPSGVKTSEPLTVEEAKVVAEILATLPGVKSPTEVWSGAAKVGERVHASNMPEILASINPGGAPPSDVLKALTGGSHQTLAKDPAGLQQTPEFAPRTPSFA
jgi:hypothetical protein